MNYGRVEDHIAEWLYEYLTDAGLDGFVVGVSGGIDSAVVSTLAAITGRPLYVLNMPIHQAPDQVSRSDEHIAWLHDHFDNVTDFTIDLSESYDTFLATMPEEARSELADVNTASRLRMVTLYSFAGARNLLVVGTGNKVEDHGIGFFTKYGDGGVDVSPIADLTKTEVRELARHMGIVPSIIGATPTDGLWGDNRSDEEQIGATYEELEWAMDLADSGFYDVDEMSARQRQVFDIYMERHVSTRHKLEAPPVCDISEIR